MALPLNSSLQTSLYSADSVLPNIVRANIKEAQNAETSIALKYKKLNYNTMWNFWPLYAISMGIVIFFVYHLIAQKKSCYCKKLLYIT
jgi:hypothetical protein